MQAPITTTPQFIRLENFQLIEIEFEFEAVSSSDELRFVCITNELRRLNLMLVDSKFSEILADVVALVKSVGNSTLQKIMEELMLRSHFEKKYAERYYQYKFNNFFQLLLYSNLATNTVCKGVIDSSLVYFYKNKQGELHYFSIYDQNKLFDLIQQQCLCKTSIVTDAEKNKKLVLTLRMPSHL